MPFETRDAILDLIATLPPADTGARAAAEARNAELTKPPASLGELETIAMWLSEWQGTPKPRAENCQIAIFAGNHGVAAKCVSAFPAEVTVQMVGNFAAGGAAINQLATLSGATLDVHPIRLDEPTGDFTETVAMNEAAFLEAFSIGYDAVNPEADVFITGEMGIGNTTAAAAILAALTDQNAEHWVGRGTGVDEAGVALKARVVAEGLARHEATLDAPLDVLAALGGREIAAMAGAILAARLHGIPTILDGFICTSAALVLQRLRPSVLDHAMAGHVSAEQAHADALNELGKTPILSLGMRLGEGSGAAVALRVVQAAAACQSGMATFAEAAVSASES